MYAIKIKLKNGNKYHSNENLDFCKKTGKVVIRLTTGSDLIINQDEIVSIGPSK
jgi:hypothetical protein